MTRVMHNYLKIMISLGLLCCSLVGFAANWGQLEEVNPEVYRGVQDALQQDGRHVALWGYSAQSYRDFDDVLQATIKAIDPRSFDDEIHLWFDGDPLPKGDGDSNVATLTRSVAEFLRGSGRKVTVHAINPYDPPPFVDQHFKVELPTVFDEKKGREDTDWRAIPGFYLGGAHKMDLVVAAGGGEITKQGVGDARECGVAVCQIEAAAKDKS